jgi:hypothetical protein
VVAAPLAVVAGETVPHGAAEHDTVQVTPLFAESLVTVAVNCAVVPAGTVAGFGATETVIVGTETVTVTVAEADFDASATEVAMIVTVKPADGGLEGAVYVVAAPLAVAAGETVPHGEGEQVTIHVTPLFDESLVTTAVICVVAPAATVVGLVETETLTAMGGAPLLHAKLPATRTTRLRTLMSNT